MSTENAGPKLPVNGTIYSQDGDGRWVAQDDQSVKELNQCMYRLNAEMLALSKAIEFRVLAAVDENPHLTQADLARTLGIPAVKISKIIQARCYPRWGRRGHSRWSPISA